MKGLCQAELVCSSNANSWCGDEATGSRFWNGASEGTLPV